VRASRRTWLEASGLTWGNRGENHAAELEPLLSATAPTQKRAVASHGRLRLGSREQYPMYALNARGQIALIDVPAPTRGTVARFGESNTGIASAGCRFQVSDSLLQGCSGISHSDPRPGSSWHGTGLIIAPETEAGPSRGIVATPPLPAPTSWLEVARRSPSPGESPDGGRDDLRESLAASGHEAGAWNFCLRPILMLMLTCSIVDNQLRESPRLPAPDSPCEQPGLRITLARPARNRLRL
jgi:hypothetical protein